MCSTGFRLQKKIESAEIRLAFSKGIADYDSLSQVEIVMFDVVYDLFALNLYNALLLNKENILDQESFNMISFGHR